MGTQDSRALRRIQDEKRLTADDISALWDRGIAEAVGHVQAHSPFYRNRLDELGLAPGDIATAADLAKLPLTTKADLSEGGLDAFCCVPRSEVVDISTTSGTTGLPTLYAMTASDVDRLGFNEFLSFTCAGLTAEDTVLLATTMDRCFIAGLAYFEGLKQVGAATVRVGSGPPGMLLSFLDRLHPTAIVSVPSFLRKVALYAEANGMDLRGSSVKRLVCIGEPLRERDLSLNPLGAQLEDYWGARVYSTYGLTELAISFCECEAGCGGHAHPELVYVEVLDDNGKPAPDGVPGEIVATPLGVQATPVLRYRTGDCAAMYREQCACGRWTPRIGPILGRKNQMMKIKGTTVYPAAVQRILDAMEDVREYVMEVTAPTALSDELTVLAAVHGDEDGVEARIAAALQAEIKVTPHVRIVSVAEIEDLQGLRRLRKKRVFIDRRGETPTQKES